MRDESIIITESYSDLCRPKMYASSILGTRKYQQDSYAYIETDQGCLAMVCDGMGGLEGGERASALAIDTVFRDYLKEMPLKNAAHFLYREAVKADNRVYNLTDRNGKLLGAGTTMVGAYIQGNYITWVSVGDSKIYIIRNNAMHTVVREHNYRQMLNERLQNGTISPEKYRSEVVRGDALTSFIGIGDLKLIEINRKPFELIEGDVIVLCSDGLYKALKETQILAIIRDNYFDYKRAAKILTDTALRYSPKGQDNTTVVLIDYSSGVPGLYDY